MSKKIKALVVGDIMIDRYTFFTSDRIASEAPIAVWDEVGFDYRLGGAANTANNLAAIGGDEVEVVLSGIIDIKDEFTRSLIKSHNINIDLCFGSKTMYKHRYVDREIMKIVARLDMGKKVHPRDVEVMESVLLGHLESSQYDVVVVSDYDKGSITPAIAEALKKQPLTILDSKRVDLRMYRGMDVLKLNFKEYGVQASNRLYETSFEELFKYVIVTKGSEGAELRQYEGIAVDPKSYKIHTEQFPVVSAPAVDVTGCGDTHTAALAFCLRKSGDLRSSVKFANECARSVVQKFGTSVPKKQ